MPPEDLEAYFLLLQGESGSGLQGLVSAENIRRAARELSLDVDRQFTPEKVEMMIENFDQGGKGAISIGDFRSIARQVAQRR